MTDPATPEPDPAAQPNPATPTDWEAEARKWERRSRDNHAKLKEAEPKLSEYQRMLDANKTETQRQADELTRWQTEAERWRTAAVSSRIEALAALDFDRPGDALLVLSDPGKYLGAGGDVDEVAIKADLAALLTDRPNWRRSADQAPPVTPRVPAPNRAQGVGAGASATTPADEFASLIRGQLSG